MTAPDSTAFEARGVAKPILCDCPILIHLATCPVEIATSAGKAPRQTSSARLQRNANEQPTGRLPGEGARPASPTISFLPSMSGAATTKCFVYGCAGLEKISRTVPRSTMRPAYITATSSAKSATTARSWVMYRAATPWSMVSCRMVLSTCSCVETSSPVVGSSSTMTDGRHAKAIASPTRCCCPPDSWCG